MSWCVTEKALASSSMGADFESDCADVDEVTVASVDILWSGNDGAATVSLQASNDKINWCDLEDTPCDITGSSGHQLIDLAQLQRFSYHYLRAKYEAGTSTTGIISIKTRLKGNRTG